MSRHPTAIGPDATLLDALVLMRGQKVSGLPVVGPTGALVGVLSQRDVARELSVEGGLPQATDLFDLLLFDVSSDRVSDREALRRVLEETTVRDAMSTPPIWIAPHEPLELAADMMRQNEINRIPVLDRERLVGIVTRNDLVRALVRP